MRKAMKKYLDVIKRKFFAKAKDTYSNSCRTLQGVH